ncbi:hypothetical protein ACFFWD_07640 [Bradyrhizobium erythrophlei]|uniref:hypothetical protein n=1 Tax=Bradyrhizobium erythrophlei TaxID=1437360 RepID=UPI0035EE668E
MGAARLKPQGAARSLCKARDLRDDRVGLLIKRVLAGVNTMTTSYGLAMPICRIGKEYGPRDFIFTDKKSIDSDTAHVERGIAKRLSVLHLTSVAKISAQDLVLSIEAEPSFIGAEARIRKIQLRLYRRRRYHRHSFRTAG